MRLPWLFLLASALVSVGNCKVIEESVAAPPGTHFKFIGKFVFGANNPRFQPFFRPSQGPVWGLSWKVTQSGQHYCLYYDDPNSWDAVSSGDLTCHEMLKKSPHGCVNLAPGKHALHPQHVENKDRPHIWYGAVVSCSKNGIHIDHLRAEFENNYGSQFGVDEDGILSLYAVFAFIYGLAAALFIHTWQTRRDIGLLTHISAHFHTQTLFSSLALQATSLILSTLHYGVYSGNGIGVPSLHLIAIFLHDASVVVFLVLSFTIAQGAKTFDSKSSSALGGVAFGYICLFLWDIFGRDPASSTFKDDSLPGAVLVCFWLVALYMFSRFMKTTLEQEDNPDRLRFLHVVTLGVGSWMVNWPIMAVVGGLLDLWVRTYAVAACTLSFYTLAQGAVLSQFWPGNEVEEEVVRRPPSGAVITDGDSGGGGVAGGAQYSAVSTSEEDGVREGENENDDEYQL